MCPELERYMRDVQYDLSSFEMTDGMLDHRLVTKRFSRSSADKEEPLPYELRPGPVLLRTMDFLICNVINRDDEEDVEVDVWYNYLWNRTRAVRNDLMQQQLTDALAVVIMERCTRFHIYAAARLCEEPPDLFDAKMNTEHLTKSLQTLKELYHDLAEKGEYFDTEREFRAYEMLLNLNDGETIVNQYSQFRVDVQKSCHVQFALKVILAVMFNNYTKFFKLVRQATFLQGCLLHRYFRQVRTKALDTIIRAYKGKQLMPLVTIISMLGFEHEGDAASYLKCHGLNVEGHDVILDKHSFILHPDELPVLARPMQMVEMKRTCSVSEVIQGGLTPNNPLFTNFPHNSFDDKGYLKPESKDASNQQCIKTVLVPEVIPIPAITKPEAQQNYQLLAHMKDVYHMVESNVIGEMASLICNEVVEKYRHDIAIQQMVRAISHELMEENLTKEVRQLSHEGYLEVEEEEREKIRRLKEAEKRERRIMEETRESVALSIHKSYNDQLVQELIVNVCQEAVSEVESELTMKELLEEIPTSYLEEALLEETVKICKSAFDALSVEQELKIKELQEKIVHRKMGEIFQAWQKQTQMSSRRKRSQETFPAACSQLTVKQQNEALGWGYQRKPTEDMTVLQLSKLKSNLSLYVEKVIVRNQLARECAWLPLPLQNILVEEVDQISPVSPNIIRQYFKVLVCWSSLASPTMKHWLRAKLGHKEKENLEKPLNNCIKVVSRKSGVEYGWALTETSVDNLACNKTLHGSSLVIFISSDMGTSDPQFQKFTQVMAKYPKVLLQHIFYDCVNMTYDGWKLMEEDLLKPEISEKLQSLLFESWRQNSILIEVVSSRLSSFVSGFVARKYVEPTLKSHSERTADGKSPMSPSALIDLFNSVITFLVEVIKSKDVINLDWPPPELTNLNQAPPLTWNKVDLMYVSDLLSVLKLPELHVEGVISWNNITKAINSYAVKVCSHHKGDATRLISHLTTILSNTRKILEPVYGYDDIDFADCELHVLQLPWTELVYACVSHKLADLPDTPVYYEPERMECFVFPRTWWAACDTSDARWAQVVREPWTLGSRKRKAKRQDQLWSNQTKVKKLPSKLLADIEVEKQKYAEFDKKLEDMLEIDEELKYLFGQTN